MKDKLKLILIPYFLIFIGILIGYTFLHWLLLIKLNLFPVNEIIVNFWIPLLLAASGSWLILRRRLKILNLNSKNASWLEFYCFIAFAFIALPTIISQNLLISASGELTKLNLINEIDNYPSTKYYTLKEQHIDKQNIGVYTEFSTSGKYNETFHITIFIVMPLLDGEYDTLNIKPFAWLAKSFHKSISNRLSEQEKDEIYRQFLDQTQMEYDSSDYTGFVYLERLENSDMLDGFINALNEDKKFIHNTTILEAVYEPYEDRNGTKGDWVIYSTLIGTFIWSLMVLIPKINTYNFEKFKSGKIDNDIKSEWLLWFDLFKPKEGFFITPILIIINLIIYLIMVFMGYGFIQFKPATLMLWGGNFGPLTLNGEWWRLFTYMFLHGSMLHILANIVGLFFLGSCLEAVLGKLKFALIYIVTGIIAGIASAYWYKSVVSVGASGAIFGLCGVLLAFLITKVYSKMFSRSLLWTIVIFIGYNLLMGLLGGSDNAAHIGGLCSGFVIGLLLTFFIQPSIEKSKNK